VWDRGERLYDGFNEDFEAAAAAAAAQHNLPRLFFRRGHGYQSKLVWHHSALAG
jgi:hypothetical protein